MEESVNASQDLWVFGYGSLVFRPSFPYKNKVQGYIKGWSRRFYQGSTDHRGVPGKPGRVVTLIKEETEVMSTWGVAYCVDSSHKEEVINYLDYREKGGYSQATVDVYGRESAVVPLVRGALIYMATEENPNYLGPAPYHEIALQIYVSVGPSGHNKDYLLQLAAALREMEVEDDHVFTLEKLVKQLMQKEPQQEHEVEELSENRNNAS